MGYPFRPSRTLLRIAKRLRRTGGTTIEYHAHLSFYAAKSRETTYKIKPFDFGRHFEHSQGKSHVNLHTESHEIFLIK